ncbi:MAG: hypothetical protein SCI25_16105, partial [Desulfuromonadales bacterium]|nr:hypothetical protein [Desulfuromonadales bacterium]
MAYSFKLRLKSNVYVKILLTKAVWLAYGGKHVLRVGKSFSTEVYCAEDCVGIVVGGPWAHFLS